jgi:hypothetical protein
MPLWHQVCVQHAGKTNNTYCLLGTCLMMSPVSKIGDKPAVLQLIDTCRPMVNPGIDHCSHPPGCCYQPLLFCACCLHACVHICQLASPTALLPEDFALLQLYGAAFSMGEPAAKAVRAVRSKKGVEPVLADPAAASDVVMVAASALSAQVYPDSR